MNILKSFKIRTANAAMFNYDSAGRRIALRLNAHKNVRGSWKGMRIVVNHDKSPAAKPVGIVLSDHVVAADGQYMEVGFSDPQALAIFEANLHNGWSDGIRDSKYAAVPVNGVYEIESYVPDHLALILPGQSPACPKGTCDRVGFSDNAPEDGVNFMEIPTMDQTETPATTPDVPPTTEPTPETPQAPAAAPEQTPAPAAPAIDAPAAVVDASEQKPPCPCAEPKGATFSEADFASMRDALTAATADAATLRSQLDMAHQVIAKYELTERTSLIGKLPKSANIDYAAKSVDQLRELVSLREAVFSELPAPITAPASEAPPASEALVGSGAKDHNRAPANSAVAQKEAAQRARILAHWA